MKLLVDNRWAGDTGIGRVYKEVMQRTPAGFTIELIRGKFSLGSPLGPYKLYDEIKRNKVDGFYSPSFMPPLSSKVPFVITIHDLNHLYFYTKFHKYYLKYVIGHLAKFAHKIITVSDFAKNEIIDKLKISDDKIKVIPNGIDQSFINNIDIYDYEDPYFLYIGNRRSYKNIDRMLAGFSAANIPSEFKILMSGHLDKSLEDLISKHKLSGRVVCIGFITESELPKIYRGAFALLFVSLMEGFGLPVLEAMASDTPVITSNTTALSEIAGNSASKVNPYSIDEIAGAIENLVNDSTYYQQLISAGRSQVKKFSWEITASETWNVIKCL